MSTTPTAQHPARHAKAEQQQRQQHDEAAGDRHRCPARQIQRGIRRLRHVDVELRITARQPLDHVEARSEEHTSELQSLMRISYAVFCWKKKKRRTTN